MAFILFITSTGFHTINWKRQHQIICVRRISLDKQSTYPCVCVCAFGSNAVMCFVKISASAHDAKFIFRFEWWKSTHPTELNLFGIQQTQMKTKCMRPTFDVRVWVILYRQTVWFEWDTPIGSISKQLRELRCAVVTAENFVYSTCKPCWCHCRCMCDACDLKGVLYKLTLKYCSRLLELTLIHTTHIAYLSFASFSQPTSPSQPLISFGKNKSTQTHTYTNSSVQFEPMPHLLIPFHRIYAYHVRCDCGYQMFSRMH